MDRKPSSLARLQQAVTLAIAGIAIAWLVHRWQVSRAGAIAGTLAIVFSYVPLMGMQCLLMWIVNRSAGRNASLPQVLRAWWGEVVLVPQVFFWRQPFRWRAEPDLLPDERRRRGVVFIHGFICNRGFWTPWLRQARNREVPFVAVNLEPVFGSIDDYAQTIDEAVRSITSATGLPPMLVCHSMGGLAARAWLRRARAATRVARVVTIGSPHRGTWLARMSAVRNGRQMRMASTWLRELESDEAARDLPPFTCWYSDCDNIVFPAETATLQRADNRLVPGPAHVELAFHPAVVKGTWDLLDAPSASLAPG